MYLPLRWFDDGGTDSDNDEDNDNNIVFYAEFIFVPQVLHGILHGNSGRTILLSTVLVKGRLKFLM